MTAQPYFPPTQTDCVIDLSHAQRIDAPGAAFATAKASGVEMIIQKATQGTSFTDPTFAERRAAAQAAGLLFGAYHFCDGTDPVAQMEHFLGVVGDTSGIVLALDAEQNLASQVSEDQVTVMIEYLRQHTGRYPLLYMGASGPDGKGYLPDATDTACDLWLPEYGSRPILPAGFSKWVLHQYTGDGINGSGYVAGIGSKLDRSYFAGTVAELHTWFQGASGGPGAQGSVSSTNPTSQPVTPTPAPPQGSAAAFQMPRLQDMQLALGVTDDGIWGPETAAAFAAYHW